jgi:hypothetical protein
MTVSLDCYVDLYGLKSGKIMKFDIFSRKKFKCTICDGKFKTQRELRAQAYETRGNKLTIAHTNKKLVTIFKY